MITLMKGEGGGRPALTEETGGAYVLIPWDGAHFRPARTPGHTEGTVSLTFDQVKGMISDKPLRRPGTEPIISSVARFRHLVAKWKDERGFSSSSSRLAQHPAYREIVKMGRPAVPLLLAELSRAPDLWFVALREITGEDPVPEHLRGRVREMAQAWIEWGREHGYAQ